MFKEQPIYGSSVAFFHRAVLILGPSGSGKSSLCLQLLAKGATLIGDDRVRLYAQDGQIYVRGEPKLANQLEIRGMGIFECQNSITAPIEIVVNLGLRPSDRLGETSLFSTDFGTLNQIHSQGVTGLADMLYLTLSNTIRKVEI